MPGSRSAGLDIPLDNRQATYRSQNARYNEFIMARKPGGKKVRVEFRRNRQRPRRERDWTQQLRTDEAAVVDARLVESVQARGELSRKRTIIDAEADPVTWRTGVVTRVHGLICYVREADFPADGSFPAAAGAARSWACTIRRVLRTRLIEQRSAVCVGDRVWFSPAAAASEVAPTDAVGVLERIATRTSTLSRRDRRQREHTIVANADQLLIVSSVAQPRPKAHLLDRYLVSAGKGDLRPIVCFNKSDLEADALDPESSRDERISVGELAAEYRALGYIVVLCSARTGDGIEPLRRLLTGHVTILAGQSGVGKSSLANAIQPGLELKVGRVSEDSEKGRHTTSHAELLPLDSGGWLVDTPGIRAFDLWNVAPGELEALFVEMAPLVAQCRFKNCTHRDEEGCAVLMAVAEGRISERRHASYAKMYEEV